MQYQKIVTMQSIDEKKVMKIDDKKEYETWLLNPIVPKFEDLKLSMERTFQAMLIEEKGQQIDRRSRNRR